MIDKNIQRVLSEAARTVAYDNPNEEWGAKWLKQIEEYIEGGQRVTDPVVKVPLNREEVQFVRNAWNGRQMEIAQP